MVIKYNFRPPQTATTMTIPASAKEVTSTTTRSDGDAAPATAGNVTPIATSPARTAGGAITTATPPPEKSAHPSAPLRGRPSDQTQSTIHTDCASSPPEDVTPRMSPPTPLQFLNYHRHTVRDGGQAQSTRLRVASTVTADTPTSSDCTTTDRDVG